MDKHGIKKTVVVGLLFKAVANPRGTLDVLQNIK